MITKTGVHHRRRTRGFTLIEAMLAVTVLGFAASGVLLPFVSGAAVRAEGIHRTLAAGLAADLLEQIVNTPFDETVARYDSYSELQGQVKDASGAVFADPSYAKFSRNVTCEPAYVPPQPPESDPAKCEFIRITVRVDYDGKEMATICRLVSQ
jgi:prepilin-type N-terminal cleavage/methylation domain-containing protein